MINLASTGIMVSATLGNKPRQKYSLFDKLSLSVIWVCGVDKNPHIILTISNQHIQENNIHFMEP